MARPSKLPPIDFSKDKADFEAYEESREVVFPKCPHKHTRIENGKLVCQCGNAWQGNTATLIQLQQAFLQA